jgi:hypothetical protein
MDNHYHLLIDDFIEEMKGKMGERQVDVNIPRVQQQAQRQR